MKPGIGPVVLLTVIHVAESLFLLFMIISRSQFTGEVYWIIATTLIRAASIYLMIKGLSDYKKSFREASVTIPANEAAE
jgi:hypothetical protein